MRSLFSGKQFIFHGSEFSLFKVERAQLNEVGIVSPDPRSGAAGASQWRREVLVSTLGDIRPEPRQWVIVADAASLALRNMDHLLPEDLPGPFVPPTADFYWARAGRDEAANRLASPGIWAVRGEHFPMVLERWMAAGNESRDGRRLSEEEIWTEVVQGLPLRKKTFEKGEVVAPRIGAVDWEAITNAAFVTVPGWPEKEAQKFLQGLYFGAYLGDESGVILNLLEV